MIADLLPGVLVATAAALTVPAAALLHRHTPAHTADDVDQHDEHVGAPVEDTGPAVDRYLDWVHQLDHDEPATVPAATGQPVPLALDGTDEWWRHTFAAARIRDQLHAHRITARLDPEMQAMVDAFTPIAAAAADQRRVDALFNEIVASFHDDSDPFDEELPVVAGHQRAGWMFGAEDPGPDGVTMPAAARPGNAPAGRP